VAFTSLGALADRLERLEVLHVVAAQRLVTRQATEDRQIDGVVVVGARRQRAAGQDDVVDRDAVHGEGVAERQLVLVRVPVLSVQSTSTRRVPRSRRAG